MDRGIENVGGLKDVYLSVLNTYYQEGLGKWKDVPNQFIEGDIKLFTTNVHALKSSSASVGAYNISELFKKLEYAGKDSNIEYIEKNLDECLEYFRELLDKVKNMLIEEGAFEDADTPDEGLLDLEESALEIELVKELQQALNNVNLKRCEEILREISANNYGSDINGTIKQMKDAYEIFDYRKVKELLSGLLDNMSAAG
ncbi:MAG: Hpt domain-containing protein [Lachnospiraceae bacterium]|nr:Hpt domain-containing protein [Lachnospiraceae bacterium]